ncbi:MAG TPA: hypothetical protein DGN59_18015 [Candidatus Latescibacteria bacterium]|nr:hypothetical protein [Candidatus Latescibacterota bacterium]HCV25355.1 hypothetical protein [Candidatus Latescibacterota bacterium]
MYRPRLIYYNDSRHYSFYRYDPPMSAQQIRQPVDELLGTHVDLLSYGLASGQTFLHDTQVGLRWGEQTPSHNHGVMWWRAYENSCQAIEAGKDPLQIVVDRAHGKGLRIMCSLRMNDASSDSDGNYYMFGKLKRDQPEIMIGAQAAGDHPYAATCANFELEQVQQERLDVIEEVCGRYRADGLEMDPYVNVFFAPAKARTGACDDELRAKGPNLTRSNRPAAGRETRSRDTRSRRGRGQSGSGPRRAAVAEGRTAGSRDPCSTRWRARRGHAHSMARRFCPRHRCRCVSFASWRAE